jgi:hypothetical protein
MFAWLAVALSLAGCLHTPGQGPSIWCVVSSPAVGTEGTSLLGVASVSPSSLLAVGSSGGDRTPLRTLGERWDGSRWSVVPTQDMDATAGQSLTALSVVSSTAAWAAGTATSRPGQYGSMTSVAVPIVERWDGSTWSIAPAPDLPNTQLNGVMAFTDQDVWVVGTSAQPINPTGIAAHWDGEGWTPFRFANSLLNAVTGRSGRDVWAVGSLNGDPATAVSEHWDGVRWTTIPGEAAMIDSAFNAVVEISSNDLWAVGTMPGPRQEQRIPLAERWNGRVWRAAPTPIQDVGPSLGAWFEGVTAISASDVWAVGGSSGGMASADRAYGTYGALTEHWNGSAWSIEVAPSPRSSTVLHAVTTASGSSDLWTVASEEDSRPALIERTCTPLGSAGSA